MKIIATKESKCKFVLSILLVFVFSVLSVGSYFVISRENVEVTADASKFKTVIIDAGHGGVDGGTSANDGTLEKNLNLEIALKLEAFLSSMGVKTILTRDTDISIHDDTANTIRQKKVSDLKNRLEIINQTDDSVFVSIHQNHFGDPQYSGTQIFYSKNNQLSQNLADKIRMSVISYLQIGNTREIKQSGSEIYLLYHAETPSVMVECGFLSNPEETQKLKDENYQRKLTFLIALGIIDYFNITEDV